MMGNGRGILKVRSSNATILCMPRPLRASALACSCPYGLFDGRTTSSSLRSAATFSAWTGWGAAARTSATAREMEIESFMAADTQPPARPLAWRSGIVRVEAEHGASLLDELLV